MRRSYSLKKDNDSKVFYNAKSKETLANYKYTINEIIRLLSLFTEQKSFCIDLVTLKYIQNETIIELVILSGKDKYIVKTNFDKISIEFDSHFYEFKIDWGIDELYAKLIKYSERLNDRIVSQVITDNHEFTLEILFEEKLFHFTIHIDMNYTLNPIIFNYIKESNNIKDLKKLYLTHFYTKQSTYDQNLETTISLYDIVNNENILMDEIIVKNRCITRYLLSRRKENVIVSKEGTNPFDGEITIRNYTMYSDVDLNNEVKELILKSRSINLDI